MKELLNWVKTSIKDNLNDFKKVEIVPDIYLIPDEKGFPAVSVIDNGIKRNNIKGQIKEDLSVKIAVFNSVFKREESIVGNNNKKGIEDLVKLIVDYFKDRYPDGYYYNVVISNESGTQTLTNDYERFIVMKTIDLIFYRIS